MTVPECVSLYLDAIAKRREAERPKGDDDTRLAPHLLDEEKSDQEKMFKHAKAYRHLTAEQKLEIGRRMY